GQATTCPAKTSRQLWAHSFSFPFRDPQKFVHTDTQTPEVRHPTTPGFPCSPGQALPSCPSLSMIQAHARATRESFLNKDDGVSGCQSHGRRPRPFSNPHVDGALRLARRRTSPSHHTCRATAYLATPGYRDHRQT